MFYKTTKHEKEQIPLQKRKNINNSKRNGFCVNFFIPIQFMFSCVDQDVEKRNKKIKHIIYVGVAVKDTKKQHPKWMQNPTSSYISSYHKVSKFLILGFQTHQVILVCSGTAWNILYFPSEISWFYPTTTQGNFQIHSWGSHKITLYQSPTSPAKWAILPLVH